MIVSFAYTTPAVLAGAKTVTRRDWSDRTYRVLNREHPVYADAYDKSPRNGGRKVGVIQIESLSREPIAQMPLDDYYAEGFGWLKIHGHTPPKSAPFPDFSWASFEAWRASGAVLTVVRFRLLTPTEVANVYG